MSFDKMTSNGEVVGIFDFEMNEGYRSLLENKLQEALTHFKEAVKRNGQSVYALRSCAAVKFMLHKNNDAKEFMHRAEEQASRGGFTRARSERVYPYTSISENVYKHILCSLTPTVLSLMGYSLPGTVIQFKDATLVRQAVEVKLPSFCDSQAETILDQEVHAKVTFTPELFRTSETELALTMKLDTVEFGVNGNLKGEMGIHGFMVYGLKFQISPTGLWNPDCVLSSVRPGDEHSAHPVQYTNGGGFQAAAGVGPSPIPTVNAQVNTSQATTTTSFTHGLRRSYKCTSFDHPWPKGWGCDWELNMYEDGRKLNVHKRVWKTHKLPLDPRNINLSMKSRGYEATWMVPSGVADLVNYKFDFKIAVQANIVVVPMILRTCRNSKLFSLPSPFPALVKFPTFTTHCEFSDSVERALPRIP